MKPSELPRGCPVGGGSVHHSGGMGASAPINEFMDETRLPAPSDEDTVLDILFFPLFAFCLTVIMSVTPSLPQRGRHPKGSNPLTPSFLTDFSHE